MSLERVIKAREDEVARLRRLVDEFPGRLQAVINKYDEAWKLLSEKGLGCRDTIEGEGTDAFATAYDNKSRRAYEMAREWLRRG